MEKVINCNFDNTEYKIEVVGNVDKIEGFIYYTFKFDEDNFIVISKFDGEKWKIASMTQNSIAEKLGRVIENLK
ncbi:Phage protein [Flavobacterium branchiophilum]|uniref:Uncharacterized protein n=1 Tax=Flavobacterium branchiophilum (strain FL-15) TaxID=1034807 RepID=G2Z6X8_FLABF|nr:hypothetical protein [Flavobacterium branchiophilum]CCB68976.1 Hypothetical protein FBFL15_0874 [Flavobacterium branchiophilum FL-15]CCB68981.1 Hypothetical protein FBFL15_0879 [Flavobacterium branchiophilum FL-15]